MLEGGMVREAPQRKRFLKSLPWDRSEANSLETWSNKGLDILYSKNSS